MIENGFPKRSQCQLDRCLLTYFLPQDIDPKLKQKYAARPGRCPVGPGGGREAGTPPINKWQDTRNPELLTTRCEFLRV